MHLKNQLLSNMERWK